MATLFSLGSDFRYAARALRHTPGFTVAAILTITLGVGVNTGVFTVLNGVLFRDLPAPDAHELVSIRQTVEGGEITARTGSGTFSAAEFRAYRDRGQTLSGLLAHANPTRTTLGSEAPQEIDGALVSCNYFAVLRQPPALGRALTEQDCAPGADPVVVLGHELWTTTFAASPDVLGRTVELNSTLFTVVGVAAEGTYGASPYHTGYFAPFSADPLLGPGQTRYADDDFHWLNLVGRRGAEIDRVRAELDVIAAQIDQLDPGRATRLAIARATPMNVPPALRGPATAAAAVLMAAFGLVLLIACANVANLLLARGTARSQEIAIRLSLGASRARVVRQLMAESLLISIAGGSLGTLLSLWSFQSLVTLALPALLPPWATMFAFDLAPDARVLTFALTLTFGTGLLFGLVPALHVSRPDVQAVIKQDAATGGGRSGARFRATLIGVQVAACMVLMIGAGLLMRGLYTTYTIDLGFEYGDVSYASLVLPRGAYEPEQAAALRQRFMDEVRALPGVDAVAHALQTPFGDENFTVPVRLPGDGVDERRFTRMNNVSPDYFSLLELPIVRGRTFTEAEVGSAGFDTRPTIVSETTARNLWGQSDAIGQTLLLGESTLQVIGVAADAQVTSFGSIDPYYIYVPGGDQVLLVKSQLDFNATAAAMRAVMQRLDPAVVARVLPLEANVGYWRGVSATVTALGTGLGLLALTLAAVGIYGVVAYAVTRRYREIGIRMALGAGARNVLGLMLRQTMRPAVIGAVIGIAAAVAGSRSLSGVLFGVSPSDPIGLGGAALLVLGVGLAAGVMAARPATRADPIATLRYE